MSAAVVACKAERESDGGRVEGDSPTVGNRPDGFVGETLVPATGGNVPLAAGAGVVGVEIGVGVGVGAVAVTTSVAVPDPGLAPIADAVAKSCHRWPTVAWAGTSTMASSSSAWPTGRLPTMHVVPLAAGHTVNAGEPRFVAFTTFVMTETPKLSACVLHTHMTKLAKPPGATCDVAYDWTTTQSCGVGGVVVGVGVGVGVGVAVGVGAAVEAAPGLDGLGDGLPDEVVPEGEVDAALVSVAALASTTFVGTVAQLAADVVLAIAPESRGAVVTPSARPSVPSPRKASAVSAPIAAGLMISGLTRATPLRLASCPDRHCCPGSPQYS